MCIVVNIEWSVHNICQVLDVLRLPLVSLLKVLISELLDYC